ncbi:hypothetical protein [Virgibacillus proomii]|uniref:hypothetical protein n=1 Tax=Virgibacillus proomii TaxID=84407 RepID=UPI001C0F4527|nr:hypothetical protein [Virgibacillus proomii]MBU5268140.1 hypothetical protein [Virgibacillus proomii]
MYYGPYFDYVNHDDDGFRNYPFSIPYPPYFENNPGQMGFFGNMQQSLQANLQTPYDYFTKPPQPMNWPGIKSESSQQNAQQNTNPQANYPPNQPPGPGQALNLDKMLSTVGQLANTYHQVSPIFKQFGSLIKTFR